MLWPVFTYSLWFLLKFDLISVTSICYKLITARLNTRRLCKAVIGLHPGAPHCEASFQDFPPGTYSLFCVELGTLLTDNYMGKQPFMSRYNRVVGKLNVFFRSVHPSLHRPLWNTIGRKIRKALPTGGKV